MREHRVPRGAWSTVVLLFFFILINFADKAVIGIAGVPIMHELHLSPREFGLIGSSFFLLFSVSAVVTGFIVNHVKTRWALLVMAVIWALTQFPMAGTVSFETIVACRIVLGAGEGPAYPVALHAAYKWFPNDLRELPTAVISLGAGVGVLAALPILNWIIVHYSWHWAFAALGATGLLWVAAWLVLGGEGPITSSVAPDTRERDDRLPYRRLLLNPTIMSGWCAYFASYWGVSLLIAWQAPFLIKGLGFTQQSIGLLTALPWGALIILLLVGGWFSQHLLSRGISSRIARGAFGGVCVIIGGMALLITPQMPSIDLKIAATTIGIAAPTIISVVVPAMVGEITPLAQRSAMLAISNAIATSAGILAPYVMGSVVETAATPLAGFETGFVICGIIMIVGGVIGIGLMRPEREATRLAASRPRLARMPTRKLRMIRR
jgi:MFS transporter, ACS family, D-galactonate transporter